MIIIVFILLEINGNNNVGTHLAHNIYWEIINHTAINKRHSI